MPFKFKKHICRRYTKGRIREALGQIKKSRRVKKAGARNSLFTTTTTIKAAAFTRLFLKAVHNLSKKKHHVFPSVEP